MNIEKMRDLLQRSKDGLQWAMDNGDESLAEQYGAQADKVAQAFERSQQSQPIAQEVPQEQPPVHQQFLESALGKPKTPAKAVLQLPEKPSGSVIQSAQGIQELPAPSKGFGFTVGERPYRPWLNDPDFRSGNTPNIGGEWVHTGAPEQGVVWSPGPGSGLPESSPFNQTGRTEVMGNTGLMKIPFNDNVAIPHESVKPAPWESNDPNTLPTGPVDDPAVANAPPEAKAELSNLSKNIQLHTGMMPHEIDTPEKRDRAIRTMAEQHLLRTQGKKPSLFNWENLLILLFAGPGAVVGKYMNEKNRYHQGATESYQKATGQVLNPLYKAIDQTSLEARQGAVLDLKRLQAKAIQLRLDKDPQFIRYNEDLKGLDKQIASLEAINAKAKTDMMNATIGKERFQAAINENAKRIQDLIKQKNDLAAMASAWMEATIGRTAQAVGPVPQMPGE